jgi:hypothetical protein
LQTGALSVCFFQTLEIRFFAGAFQDLLLPIHKVHYVIERFFSRQLLIEKATFLDVLQAL